MPQPPSPARDQGIPERAPGGLAGELLAFAEDLREEGVAVGERREKGREQDSRDQCATRAARPTRPGQSDTKCGPRDIGLSLASIRPLQVSEGLRWTFRRSAI